MNNNKISATLSSKSDEWETPKHIFNHFNFIYGLELDAAATKDNKLCANFYTLEDDALKQDWSKYKHVWCNPPYGRKIAAFVKKAYEESLKGCVVVMLIPSRTDTKWWHEYCSQGSVKFLRGRLKFNNRTFPSYKEDMSHKISPAPFASAIVIFDKNQKPETSYIKI